MIAHIVTSKASWWNSLARPIRNQTRSTLIFIHPSSTASPIVRYVLAALAVAVTTGCGLLVFQFAESRPFPLFFLPILFSGWFFGAARHARTVSEALSHGIGSEVQKPLAVVIIGGLIAATLLTLIVLPTLYFVIEDGLPERSGKRLNQSLKQRRRPLRLKSASVQHRN